MAISASQVKELRETTGLGMMECKKALEETDGNMEAAIELLRKKAGAKVEKKAGRTAAEGVVSIASSGNVTALVEVNSETDFVAKGDAFQEFAAEIAACVAANGPADVDALMGLPLKSGDATTVAAAREDIVQKLGENISIRRFVAYDSSNTVGSYVHTTQKIGVLVELEGGAEDLARDLAMHIAASRPAYVSADDVPAEVVAKEREIFTAQAQESGKPAEIIEKMVEGRVRKQLAEMCLLGQPFVKDPDTTVEKLLKSSSAKVLRFDRFEVGEGMEKRQEDFAAEVMAQVKGG
jgi:elongation factor Ts